MSTTRTPAEHRLEQKAAAGKAVAAILDGGDNVLLIRVPAIVPDSMLPNLAGLFSAQIQKLVEEATKNSAEG